MSDAQDLSSSVEGDVNNFFNKASKVDESPVIEGSDDFFEVTDLNPPGGAKGANSAPSDSIGQDTTAASTDEYAVSIAGVTPTTGSDGIPISATTFTIRAVNGTFTITSDRIANSGTLGPQTLQLNPAQTGTFSGANEYRAHAVFGVVTFTKDTEDYLNAITTAQGNGTKIVACRANDFPFTFVEGFSNLDTDNPQYMFKIAEIQALTNDLDRRVFVNQLHVGPKEVDEKDTPFYADFDHTNNKLTIGQGASTNKEVKVDQIVLQDATGVRLNIDIADLPATAKDAAAVKLREVKVCNSGVPATAFILMSQPVNIP